MIVNKIFNIILLLLYIIIRRPIPANAGLARINAKERKVRWKKRKGIEAHRVKNPTPSQATDALIGDEEQNGKQKRTK